MNQKNFKSWELIVAAAVVVMALLRTFLLGNEGALSHTLFLLIQAVLLYSFIHMAVRADGTLRALFVATAILYLLGVLPFVASVLSASGEISKIYGPQSTGLIWAAFTLAYQVMVAIVGVKCLKARSTALGVALLLLDIPVVFGLIEFPFDITDNHVVHQCLNVAQRVIIPCVIAMVFLLRNRVPQTDRQ